MAMGPPGRITIARKGLIQPEHIQGIKARMPIQCHLVDNVVTIPPSNMIITIDLPIETGDAPIAHQVVMAEGRIEILTAEGVTIITNLLQDPQCRLGN